MTQTITIPTGAGEVVFFKLQFDNALDFFNNVDLFSGLRSLKDLKELQSKVKFKIK